MAKRKRKQKPQTPKDETLTKLLVFKAIVELVTVLIKLINEFMDWLNK